MHRYHWLETLHATHYATLLRLAQNRLRSLTGSTSEAEDVVQDVFLLAAEKDISKLENPLRWLIKATINMCLKRMDRVIREAEKEQRVTQIKTDGNTESSVPIATFKDDDTQALEILLALEQTLSKDDWKLLQMYCLQSIPVEEISQQLGLSVNVLRVRIFRIRKNLDKNFRNL